MKSHKRLALALDVSDRSVVVIGGGAVAERKVTALLAGDATVTIVAPELTAGLRALADEAQITWVPRGYRTGDLAGATLAFAATDSRDINRQVAADAAAAGVWCNVASPPAAGTFHVMATVERDGVTIGIHTAGLSPYVARRVREMIESAVPAEVGALARLLGELRETVQRSLPTEAERRAAYDRMWSSAALARLREGDEEAAREILRACLEE